MNELYKKAESMIKYLQDTEKITFVSAEYRYFSEAISANGLLNDNPFVIAPSILQFYRELDFVNISWYVKDGMLDNYMDKELDIAGGMVNIPNFSSLFNSLHADNRRKLVDPTHAFPDDQEALLESMIPFDFIDGTGSTCFKLENNKMDDNLYLVRSGIECFVEPMGIGCRDYFLNGCSHYFFSNWQEAIYLKQDNKIEMMKFYLKELSLKII